MAVTRTETSNHGKRRGATRSPVGLEGPLRAQRPPRWPELIVGMLVAAVCALVGVWLYGTSIEREPVLALRADVARGEPLDLDDLRIVQVNVDADSNLLSADQIGEVEGRAALVDLRAGTLVSADLFAAGGLVGPGDGLVGLSLDPGEYPTAALGPGDVVRVVATSVDPAAPGVVVVVEQAVVVDVAAVAGGLDRLFVSLSMPTEQADGVAGAGAEDRVRLIQVGGGR